MAPMRRPSHAAVSRCAGIASWKAIDIRPQQIHTPRSVTVHSGPKTSRVIWKVLEISHVHNLSFRAAFCSPRIFQASSPGYRMRSPENTFRSEQCPHGIPNPPTTTYPFIFRTSPYAANPLNKTVSICSGRFVWIATSPKLSQSIEPRGSSGSFDADNQNKKFGHTDPFSG